MKGLKLLSALGVAAMLFSSFGVLALASPEDQAQRPQGPPQVRGFVKSIEGANLLVKTRRYHEGTDEVTVHLFPATTCKGRQAKDATSTEGCDRILRGSKVLVWGERQGDGSINASFVAVGGVIHPPAYRVWSGKIQSIQGNEVEVKNRAGNQYEVMLTKDTIILPKDHGALAVGDAITTIAQWNPEALGYDAVVVLVHRPSRAQGS